MLTTLAPWIGGLVLTTFGLWKSRSTLGLLLRSSPGGVLMILILYIGMGILVPGVAAYLIHLGNEGPIGWIMAISVWGWFMWQIHRSEGIAAALTKAIERDR